MEFIETSRGWVAFEPPLGDGLAVVAVGGAFQPPDYLRNLRSPLPLGYFRLPGCGAPTLDHMSVEAFSEAFDEALPARPVILLGISTGATVALNMRKRSIRHVVAVEPFLSTSGLWPLIEHWQPNLGRMAAKEARFVSEVFGYYPDHIEGRSFGVRCRAPFTVVVGSEPLEPKRATTDIPSLTSASDRDQLRRLGGRIMECPGGHDLLNQGGQDAVLAALSAAVDPVSAPS